MNQRMCNKKTNLGIKAILPKSTLNNENIARKRDSSPGTSICWDKTQPSVLNTSVTTSKSANTSTSISDNSSRVLGLTEGRGYAQCEVGLSFIDTSYPNLILCQIADVFSYINTLTKINILNPTEILVPTTFTEHNNRLVKKILQQFPGIKIVSAARRTFNKSNGMQRILELCLPAISSICIGLQYKYYALSSASAVLTYLQNNLNIYYMTGTINVIYQESEGFAIIDVSTADRLELVSCTKPAQATKNSTLYGILNRCYTKIGARTLRSAILQPPFDKYLIEERLHCVTELVKNPQKLIQIQASLQKIQGVEQLLSITTIMLHNPNSVSTRALNYLLYLNGLVDLIEPLRDILDTFRQSFYREICETLHNDTFNFLKTKVRYFLLDTAQPVKGDGGNLQRCFAIKPGLNGLLDLIRQTFSERLDDLKEYVRLLGQKYNLALTLNNNNLKGYHMVLKLNTQQKKLMSSAELPAEFIQVHRLPGSFTMKTPNLVNLSTRLEDILAEILKISNRMITELLKEINQHLGFFYKFCEDIAKLDMFQSLAQVAINNKYSRPKFTEYTEIIQAKHPLLDRLCPDDCIENNVFISNDYNIQIITGPNSSGKSIYIRQVMLLQIMAQMGSYVPAKHAKFRPASRMFARVYLEGDIEWGASAFTLEMSEIKYMLNVMDNSSLYLLDEPCRSTCYEEGQALALAICEKFCTGSAYLFVSTHYTLLTKLYDMYVNVKLWQMETLTTGDNPERPILKFTYKLIPGVTPLQLYALTLTKHLWPGDLYEIMWNVMQKLDRDDQDEQIWYVEKIDDRVRLKYELESLFRKLKYDKKLTVSALNKYLNRYQEELQKNSGAIELRLQITSSNLHTSTGKATSTITDHPGLSDHNYQFNQNQNMHNDRFETSSYIRLDNFLRESQDNINILIPEISIRSSPREYCPNSEAYRREGIPSISANPLPSRFVRSSPEDCSSSSHIYSTSDQDIFPQSEIGFASHLGKMLPPNQSRNSSRASLQIPYNQSQAYEKESNYYNLNSQPRGSNSCFDYPTSEMNTSNNQFEVPYSSQNSINDSNVTPQRQSYSRHLPQTENLNSSIAQFRNTYIKEASVSNPNFSSSKNGTSFLQNSFQSNFGNTSSPIYPFQDQSGDIIRSSSQCSAQNNLETSNQHLIFFDDQDERNQDFGRNTQNASNTYINTSNYNFSSPNNGTIFRQSNSDNASSPIYLFNEQSNNLLRSSSRHSSANTPESRVLTSNENYNLCGDQNQICPEKGSQQDYFPLNTQSDLPVQELFQENINLFNEQSEYGRNRQFEQSYHELSQLGSQQNYFPQNNQSNDISIQFYRHGNQFATPEFQEEQVLYLPNNQIEENNKRVFDQDSANDQSISYSPLSSPVLFSKKPKTSHFRNPKHCDVSFQENVVTSSQIKNFIFERDRTAQIEGSDSMTKGSEFPCSSSEIISGTPSSSQINIKVLEARKFVGIKKLTKRQIEEEYNKQDQQMFETDMTAPEFPFFFNQRLNRPSVKQMQQIKAVALFRRTSDHEIEVIPARPQESSRKNCEHFDVNTPLNANVDVTIFSDENAKIFEEFLNSKEKDLGKFDFKQRQSDLSQSQKQSELNLDSFRSSEQDMFPMNEISFGSNKEISALVNKYI